MNDSDYIRRLRNAIVEVIRLAISRLYHLSIEDLKQSNPSLEEIKRLCKLFNKIVEGTDIDGQFTDAISVISEAADAVIRHDSQCLIDCAYHLEDLLSRLKQ